MEFLSRTMEFLRGKAFYERRTIIFMTKAD